MLVSHARGKACENSKVARIRGNRAGALQRNRVPGAQFFLKSEIVKFGRRARMVVAQQSIGRLNIADRNRAPARIGRRLKLIHTPRRDLRCGFLKKTAN